MNTPAKRFWLLHVAKFSSVVAAGDPHGLAPCARHPRVIVARRPPEDQDREDRDQSPEIRLAAPRARHHLVDPRGTLQAIAVHMGVMPLPMRTRGPV